MDTPKIRFSFLDTPIGRLRLEADEHALLRILFEGETGPGAAVVESGPEEESPLLARAAAQLGAYFRGELREFDLPMRPEGSAFQREVWARLVAIPYGQTVSYGELAAGLGRPSAARAVGAACGRNPIPILIPCHRVVGGNRKLTGYRGGLEIKRILLDLEAPASPLLGGAETRPGRATARLRTGS